MKGTDSIVKQTVDTILKSDDKLLASLQKLASDLDPINTEDVEIMARIKELSARLIKNTVEGIRTKLDRIYLEALHSSRATVSDDSQETLDLQDELESLYSEILPVAQMSAEQQFLQPALRTMAASSGKGQERAVKAVKYVR
jgi:predicted transcriptional regulator